MKRFFVPAMAGAIGIGAVALMPATAGAQGVKTVIAKKGGQNCPSGWQNTPDGKSCKPNNSSSPAIYHLPKSGTCAEGYDKDIRGWCVEDKFYKSRRQSSSRSSGGSSASSGSSAGTFQSAGLVLEKPKPSLFCPTGYRSTSQATHCITIYENAPPARAKPAGGCNADEIEEWGVWCTTRETTLPYQKMENATISDFNNIVNATGRWPLPERKGHVTPLMQAIGAPAPAAQTAASGTTQTATTTAAAEAKPQKCKDGKGAAAGRALGGLLGGLGKKRGAAAAAEAVGAVADCVE